MRLFTMEFFSLFCYFLSLRAKCFPMRHSVSSPSLLLGIALRSGNSNFILPAVTPLSASYLVQNIQNGIICGGVSSK